MVDFYARLPRKYSFLRINSLKSLLCVRCTGNMCIYCELYSKTSTIIKISISVINLVISINFFSSRIRKKHHNHQYLWARVFFMITKLKIPTIFFFIFEKHKNFKVKREFFLSIIVIYPRWKNLPIILELRERKIMLDKCEALNNFRCSQYSIRHSWTLMVKNLL